MFLDKNGEDFMRAFKLTNDFLTIFKQKISSSVVMYIKMTQF
jgi:hypothetical protein